MITEDYVSFEIAKLLKEKGFNEATFHDYDEEGKRWFEEVLVCHNSQGGIACPTLQMAMKWLREVHNYSISICLDSYVEPYDNQYYIFIRRRKDKYDEISPCEQVYFDSYEEACEAAIKYCIESLI